MARLKLAESLAALEGVEIKVRDLVDEWILITYDLPVTKEGNKIRFAFIKEVTRIGGIMHSKSCYLLPHTEEAEKLVYSIGTAKLGEVYIWTSKANDADTQVRVNAVYDLELGKRIEAIKERIERAEYHLEQLDMKRARLMNRRTNYLFNSLLFMAFQRGSKKLFNEVKALHSQIEDLQGRLKD